MLLHHLLACAPQQQGKWNGKKRKCLIGCKSMSQTDCIKKGTAHLRLVRHTGEDEGIGLRLLFAFFSARYFQTIAHSFLQLCYCCSHYE